MMKQREAQVWENVAGTTDDLEIDLRDGTAYLRRVDILDIVLKVDTAQMATILVDAFMIKIVSSSGYTGSLGSEIVVSARRTTNDSFQRHYTVPENLIDVQTQKSTEKMQPLKLQFWTMDGRKIERDFVYLRMNVQWTDQHVRNFNDDMFEAH